MSTLFLCGAGNSEGVRLALAVARVRQCWDQVVLLDDDPAKRGLALLGVAVIGPLDELSRAAAGDEAVNLVTRTCARREAMRARIAAFGVPCAGLVHPSVDTDGASLDSDVTVYAGATIGPEAHLGTGSVVFMGAVVGHESRIGRGCVIAANAVLNARVRLDDQVYVGSNATIVPEVSVGAAATIGAGSAVLHDVPPGTTALGVPAEVFRTQTAAPRPAIPQSSSIRILAGHAELRRVLAGLWKEVLQAESVGEDENFFDVGGTSMLACHLAERTRLVTGLPMSLLDVFQFPTVRAQADHLGRPLAPGPPPAAVQRAQLRRQMHERVGR
jgi:sugar O-acyltransferase (sialic acid O-acetyltransferase NeuD family)